MPPVPRRPRSYAALRLPRLHRPRLRLSLAFGLPRDGGFFFAEPPLNHKGGVGRPRVPPRTRGASGIGLRLPVAPVVSRGQTWASQVPGSSSSHAPRSEHPARVRRSLALAVAAVLPSEEATPSAHRHPKFSRLTSRGSSCSRAYASLATSRRRRKARYRPAG
jgi:hypothetical protein